MPHAHLDAGHLSAAHPLLIFGGAYSNVRATRALREVADRLAIPPTHVICTGDVVAYAAEPVETAGLVREWGCLAIAGNCEEQLGTGAADCGCNFEEGTACDRLAKGWYPYADRLMTPDLRRWMTSLPRTLTFVYADRRFRVVHGGVEGTADWIFGSDVQIIQRELDKAEADVVLAGHCGLPFLRQVGRRTWFNSGALGMPANDGTPDVWYGLATPDRDGSLTLSLHRLAYEHMEAAAAMRRSGHANPYARTLITGIWPSMDVLPATERLAAGQRLRERKLRLVPRPVTEVTETMC